jgi:hypothetical protein
LEKIKIKEKNGSKAFQPDGVTLLLLQKSTAAICYTHSHSAVVGKLESNYHDWRSLSL